MPDTTTGALARVVRGVAELRTRAGERCDLCGEEVPPDHRHLLDTGSTELMCACRACSVLFVEEAASEGRYRLVPERRVRLPKLDTTALGVPVGLAFFVTHRDGTVTAHYPSPAGATRWEADAEAWRELAAGCPPLATLEPDVEALLVNTARGQEHHWIAPVDDCFRMVAVVRTHWRGLSGGGRVWPAIEEFFAELTERQ
ncbi:DUF5947 family protein [Streptomyces naganishii]|uniref:Uncharacterized protein n=1 Tax=Streptomyces naganishii JCM 4654 TaxID=1306179 RepID=A0A918Y7F9_9ACTN|nr:DUF5947 family protein [Streptomyces naganishii]GHD93452.1 hypothetical protein GCM10010508_50440 [Streptomyces naganishii JCM 4654]